MTVFLCKFHDILVASSNTEKLHNVFGVIECGTIVRILQKLTSMDEISVNNLTTHIKLKHVRSSFQFCS